MNRRAFLSAAALPCLAANKPAPAQEDARFTVEARFYEKLADKKIRCKLCPRECVIDESERGYCGVRENHGGRYFSLVYGRICSANADPIEKKPLFHFAPGSMAFSVATAGCNVNCKMCQNWQISQIRPEQARATFLPPASLASLARASNCAVVAFTYNEPVVFTEYVLDAADAVRAAGLRSVMISGGYVQREPLQRLCRSLDAIKIDLKGFSEKFYREVVNGQLKPVLEALATIRKSGVWSEIVYLVIPTLNDSDADLKGMARWVKTELGTGVPVHFSRFHPDYLLKNLPPTPLATLERAKAICDAEGLHYVYLGNVPGHPAENTWCPKCKKVVVERAGFTIRTTHLNRGRCGFCGEPIAGVWEALARS